MRVWLFFLCLSASAQYRVRIEDKVVTMPVEEYVARVVTGESGTFKNTESLKAMAVAARTYAAYMRGRHSKEGFDFCNTTHCQRLVTPASQRAVAAAEATKSELLWFADKPAMTLYTQSCGGVSEGMAGFPYLTVHTDPYCHTTWQWSGSELQIVQALRAAGLKTPDKLRAITIVRRTASERAQTLSLSGDGATELIAATSFRFALGRTLGWNTLRSELFEVFPGFLFKGSGEGHGRGLCQRGADEMAFQGKSYQDILAFYYPHTLPFQWTRLKTDNITLLTNRPDSDRRLLALAGQEIRRNHLPWPVPKEIELRIYPTLDTYRNATAEPGWVAARTQGTKIELQPTEILEAHQVLERTLHHEMLHVFVEFAAAPGLPVWFREGLVEWLAGEKRGFANASPDETAVRQRKERQLAEAGYNESLRRVSQLVTRYGATAVLGWVTSGLPPAVVKNSSASEADTKNR